MDIELIYRISSVVAIVAALVAASAGGVQWWSGNVISAKQEAKITVMATEARIRNPTIYSQTTISQNIHVGDLFAQKYLVSINSPAVHVPLYTYIQYEPTNGDIERVGEMQLNDVGGGVRQVEGKSVSYVDTEYTLKTSRALSEGEGIVFTLEERPNTAIRRNGDGSN